MTGYLAEDEEIDRQILAKLRADIEIQKAKEEASRATKDAVVLAIVVVVLLLILITKL